MTLDIHRDQLTHELEALASFSDAPAPAVTRIVFSEADRLARQWLKCPCAEAGLVVREDAVGNTFFRWIGSSPELPAVASGSHIDAIPHSGRYDGTVGVLGALEAIRALQRADFRPRRSIELVLFTSEEPTRFGIGCLGSRLMSGALSPAHAAGLRDSQGARASTKSAAPPVSPAHWTPWRCPPATITLSSSCTLSRGHRWSAPGPRSALSPPSLPPPRYASKSKARADMPAPSSCPIAAMPFWPALKLP